MFTASHLHAMLIHFPIALILVAFLFQCIHLIAKKSNLQTAGFYLLILGTIGTILSYLTGDAAGEGIEEGPLAAAMELHEQAATFALWLTIATTVLYAALYYFKSTKTWLFILAITLFTGSVASIARTGYLGGQLVYKHGAGVELALPDFSNPNAFDQIGDED